MKVVATISLVIRNLWSQLRNGVRFVSFAQLLCRQFEPLNRFKLINHFFFTVYNLLGRILRIVAVKHGKCCCHKIIDYKILLTFLNYVGHVLFF